MTIGKLPEDVVELFLSMLPVKSLLRFKSVCKAWCVLIDNPSFIAKHFKHATFNKNECILVKRFIEGEEQEQSKIVLSFVSEETLDVISTDIDVPFSEDNFLKFIGPCNGIICLSVADNIVLCNPATREFNALPPCFDDYLPGLTQRDLSVGFGFDENNNDYKVVKIIELYSDDPDGGHGYTVKVEIYNLSSDSWRKLDASVPPIWFAFCFELLFNGAFHWYAPHYNDSEAYDSILSFHMSSEVFEEIPFPDIRYGQRRSSLAVFNNESLAVILYEDFHHEEKNFEIWVMKEYGVKESWTKQFTIGPLLEIHSPLLFGKYNELLLQRETGQLVSCDLNTNRIRDSEVHGAPTSLRVVMYVESLVSMKRARWVVT